MPLDDRLRRGLREIADRVDPDVDRGLERALASQSASPARRATTLLAYAAAIGLAIAVVTVGASSLLNRVGTNPSPTASAQTSSASPEASVDACPRDEGGSCAGALEAGRHRSAEFIPPIDYDIPADSTVAWDNPEDLPGTFTLHPAGPDTDAIFFFRDVRVLTPGCNPELDEAVGHEAADIAAWITANPNLTATTPEPVTVGGLTGVLIDLSASDAYTTDCGDDRGGVYPSGLPIVPLFAGAGSGDLTWFVGGTERMRLYVLDMPGGGNLVISIDAIAGDFETLLEISQPVMDSIRFDPAYY
jgi:hypothetical protein